MKVRDSDRMKKQTWKSNQKGVEYEDQNNIQSQRALGLMKKRIKKFGNSISDENQHQYRMKQLEMGLTYYREGFQSINIFFYSTSGP